jgi:3-oxoacyl-[acyl-carrier protein] reductase
MDLGLRGKIALVAGSSSGLGEAVAHSLASEGTSLALCSIDEEGLERVKREVLQATGVDALSVPVDLSVTSEVERAVSTALKRFGHVDILVSNTGGPPAALFEDTTPEMWDDAHALLLMSAVNLTRGVLPGMTERQWGRIIYCTSIAVKQPVEDLVLSNSVRSGVTGLARTLANEVAGSGVTVNCVLPGYTRTQRVEYLAEQAAAKKGITKEEAVAEWESEIPMGRLAEPAEFAAMVTFLASEQASYVTGQSIAVDGGWIRSLF